METNVSGLLTEALTAHVQTVLADETVVVARDAANIVSIAQLMSTVAIRPKIAEVA